MRLPLKFLLPLLILITGFILIAFETLMQKNSEYERVMEQSFVHARVVGNRLASLISLESKSGNLFRQKMLSTTASYMADSLDQVQVFTRSLKEVYNASVVSYGHGKEDFSKKIAAKVIHEQFSDIRHIKESQHIVGYFPLDLKIRKGENRFKHQGVLYLVFDLSRDYANADKTVLNNFIMNVMFMGIILLVFSLLGYFFIFRRLNLLHNATKKMALGDFDVTVKTNGSDELSDVIDAFNSMAMKMNEYKHSMQKEVEKVVKEHTEHSKILIQQSRLASMGEMIGNIAHQWRQPLNAVGLIIQKLEIFSQRDTLNKEILATNTEKAQSIIKNMSRTIDDFRDFFKPDKQKELFYLQEVTNNVMDLLDAGFRHNDIAVELKIDSGCQIYGFKNEFSQVIVNIFNNSKDALIANEVKNPKIFLEAKDEDTKLSIKISDNAGGIPQTIINRIFEPYYTTKDEGVGTGIGLYMSKMIVEDNMHGTLSVKNIDDGAEFTMVFTHTTRSEE